MDLRDTVTGKPAEIKWLSQGSSKVSATPRQDAFKQSTNLEFKPVNRTITPRANDAFRSSLTSSCLMPLRLAYKGTDRLEQ